MGRIQARGSRENLIKERCCQQRRQAAGRRRLTPAAVAYLRRTYPTRDPRFRRSAQLCAEATRPVSQPISARLRVRPQW